jgi:hypothetical protein
MVECPGAHLVVAAAAGRVEHMLGCECIRLAQWNNNLGAYIQRLATGHRMGLIDCLHLPE